jgi:hypothetical protein
MAKTADPVDEIIKKMSLAQQEIAHSLRALIRQAAPGLAESIKWGNACYSNGGNVCSIIPYQSHVNLAFFRGAELDDPEGLLEGTGKAMRHVTVRSVGNIRGDSIAALVRAALSLPKKG